MRHALSLPLVATGLAATLGLPPAAAAQLPARDSLRALTEAREAQRRFESYRRFQLPRVAGSAPSSCDIIIGRMCYWDDGPDVSRPPEPAPIARARTRLTRTLGALAERVRGDRWIAGQRVRYLVESGDDSAAVVAARECWAAAWWCAMLRGYALHEAGQYAAAGAAVDSALQLMPADTACRWRDISLLLEDEERAPYRRLPCANRAAYERRYWDLADPSYAIQGNDRRTEHFARVLLAALSEDAANAYGLAWGDDLRELTVRYGVPTWYTQSLRSPYELRSSVEGHDRQPSYHFGPQQGPSGSVAWSLRDPRARERYSPPYPYLDSLAELPAQFGMFRRGDSAIVVAVYDAGEADSAAALPGVAPGATPGTDFIHGAVLGVADSSGVTVAGRDALGRRVRRARTAWHGVVAGVETYDPARRRAARARAWVAPPRAPAGAPHLSTLLLFAPDAPTAAAASVGDSAASDSTADVATLDDALARALTAAELRGRRRLGVYWEVYGPATAASVHPADSVRADSVESDSTKADSASTGGMDADSTSTDGVRADSTSVDSARGSATPADRAPADTIAASGDVTITVTRVRDGALSRLAQALHLAPRTGPIAVAWRDAAPAAGTSARSVVLDLTQLPPGSYLLALSVGRDPARRTTATREIRLR